MNEQRRALIAELVELSSPPPAGLFSYTSEWVWGAGWCTTVYAPASGELSVAEHQSWLETALGRGRRE